MAEWRRSPAARGKQNEKIQIQIQIQNILVTQVKPHGWPRLAWQRAWTTWATWWASLRDVRDVAHRPLTVGPGRRCAGPQAASASHGNTAHARSTDIRERGGWMRWYTGCRGAWERCTGGRERGGRLRRRRGTRVAVVRCALLVVRVLHGLA